MFPFRVKRLLYNNIKDNICAPPRVLSCSLRSCLPCLKKNRLVKITTKKQETCVVLHVVISPCIFTLIGCVEVCHDSTHFSFLRHMLVSAGMSVIWFSRGDRFQPEVQCCRNCEQAVQQANGDSLSCLFIQRAPKNRFLIVSSNSA